MNREILFQICDVCEEILNEISNHLSYLNISVYKSESISKINEQIEQLRMLMGSITIATAIEPFLDFEAEKINKVPVPGECSFSMRVHRLLINIRLVIKNIRKSYVESEDYSSVDALEKVKKHKATLQSSCPVGSKRWKFLQSI
ncbi:MAG: hypothetical protein AB8G05_14485 [Oligoflexales bacterium]